MAVATQPVTRDRLRRLAEIRPERGCVLSVFLNLDPAELPTPPARATAISSLMTAAAHRVEQTAGDHDEREALKADLERVGAVLRGSDLAADGTHGVAVYACAPADLLEVVRLPHPVPSEVVVDRTPFVEPLVREASGERWCVLLANRRAARIFSGPADRVEETDRLEDDVHRRHHQGGWSQANYQRSIEKDMVDHVAGTVEVLFAAFKRAPFDHLLLGAPAELVSSYEQRLHPYLRDRVAGRLQLDVEHAGIEEVRRHAGEAAEAWSRRCEREALDRLAEAVGRGERGAAGLEAVLAALNEARVEQLLVAPGLRAPGFRDPRSGLLFATAEDATDGEPQPVGDVVEAALARAIAQAAVVRVIRHHEGLGPLGGIAALLRF